MGVPKMLTLTEEAVQSRQFSYIDFLLPGIMGMGLMFNALIGIATDITRYREQSILKRIRATPLPPRAFVLGQVLAYLVVVVIQATLIILVGKLLFDATVYGSLLALYAIALVGTMIFLNIGFTIAGLSRTPNGASGFANVIAFPMMFLSGTFFPTADLPAVIAAVVEYLPLTPIMDAMRSVSLHGEPLSALGSQLLLIGAWVVASFALAASTFRFRET
jgi:ABC-2 type transport system permease protein